MKYTYKDADGNYLTKYTDKNGKEYTAAGGRVLVVKTDSEGNEYSRMDDEFISELGMTRMAGTTLNFGSNEGWIAFEIDENAEGLELSYPFEAEEYHCAL